MALTPEEFAKKKQEFIDAEAKMKSDLDKKVFDDKDPNEDIRLREAAKSEIDALLRKQQYILERDPKFQDRLEIR